MRKHVTNASLALAVVAVLAMAAPAAEESEVQEAPNQSPSMAAQMAAQMAARASGGKTGDLPKFEAIAKDYKKVVSTADGEKSLYAIWIREKDAQMLAELPRSFERQKLFIAFTVAGGTRTSGVQTGSMYAYWKRFDKRLALIEPNYAVRTTGDLESKKSLSRVFTDRVILDVPIAAMGPGGGPVIDMDALLVGKAGQFFGRYARGANTKLAKIAKAKAFPQNIELAFRMPIADGRFGTFYYSISVLPENTGYKPREADPRIGYFTTSHMDLGHPGKDTPWVRNITRWKLEKADRKLKMSPPKEPIVFYLEHTIPVRYRRWVREGLLEWNRAFEKIGIVGSIEVYQQDANTGAHMEKDPEDARYNFILWTNANMGFAIGPSRIDPRTGQILDADIVMDEGFISGWAQTWKKVIPEAAMINFGPDTLAWLKDHPQWDPRVRLVSPTERGHTIEQLRQDQWRRHGHPFAGHPAVTADPTLLGDDEYDGLAGRLSQVNGYCDCVRHAAEEIAFFRLAPDVLLELALGDEADEDEDADAEDEEQHEGDEEQEEDEDEPEPKPKPWADDQMLDGVPESFIGPLLKDVIMHEVGHTLGLRHNFKASTIYTLEEINCEAHKGQPIIGSVMDYSPININFEDGPVQGDYTMPTIGPYDYWAIEYGYTFDKNLEPILARVAEPELIFGTDEDSWGSDPRARTFDLGKDPLKYAESQMRLINHLRGKILDRMVKKGESWAKAREGYEMLLRKHVGALSIAANWIGGAYSNRDLKGDPGERTPVEPVPVEKQRRAIEFVIDNAFDDEAFGLTPELLSKMSVDKWWDEGFTALFADPAWPVHDRILGIQATALTMLMNPTTLNRVFDNEYRVDAEEDAVTLPELLYGVSDAVWTELDETKGRKYTDRRPMISSLRRDLQREHLERLIDLSLPNAGFGVAAMPVRNLSVSKLRELHEQIDDLLDDRSARKLDHYTIAHLSEARVRIEKALDAQYIYNTDDISGGGGFPFFLFGREDAPPPMP